jgi:hypothetical protein
MMTNAALDALAATILANNEVDEETAAWYADLIGDSAEVDADGLFVVRDFNNGVIVARVSIPGR